MMESVITAESPPERPSGTPRLVLDLARLERNIAAMARRVEQRGASLRPHFKTHKSPEIMRRQLAGGATGVTVATIHEAFVAVEGGARDILIAHPPVGREKLEAIDRLLDSSRVVVACSEREHLHALARLERPHPIEYYWEIDSGAARLGTAPGEPTAQLLDELRAIPGVELAGIMTFSGHAYAANDPTALSQVAEQEARALTDTAAALRERGIVPGELSAGSTPLASAGDDIATEYRFGNYVFYDATQVALGSATVDDCALWVEATVISRPTDDRLILDAGSKALSSERMSPASAALALVRDHPELVLERMYEEHGICRITADCSLEIGDRVEVIPNHACTCANLHGSYSVRTPGGEHDRWPVQARGWSNHPDQVTHQA